MNIPYRSKTRNYGITSVNFRAAFSVPKAQWGRRESPLPEGGGELWGLTMAARIQFIGWWQRRYTCFTSLWVPEEKVSFLVQSGV